MPSNNSNNESKSFQRDWKHLNNYITVIFSPSLRMSIVPFHLLQKRRCPRRLGQGHTQSGQFSSEYIWFCNNCVHICHLITFIHQKSYQGDGIWKSIIYLLNFFLNLDIGKLKSITSTNRQKSHMDPQYNKKKTIVLARK